ncbi:MAG: HD-GYP domain-containing protein [Moorellales bacterium]
MPVAIPPMVFTLGGSMALALACLYLYRAESGAPYAAIWLLAWTAHTGRFAFEALYREAGGLSFQWIFHALVLASGALLLYGTCLFAGCPKSYIRTAAVLAVAGAGLLFCLLAPARAWADLVSFSLCGTYYLWSGLLLVRKACHRPPARLAGWVLIAWGIHKFDYAALNVVLPALLPFGYLLGGAFGLLLAGSLVVFPLDAARERQIKSLREVVALLAAAIEARDAYTVNHSLNVARTAAAVAAEMGLSSHDREQIYLAGLLHDIGKIGVSDAILGKPEGLAPEEFERIRQHPVIGAGILQKGGPAFAPLIPAIRHHHERWDGSGYPDGLRGESIPLWARILAVADAFDAMTSDRPYRRARSLGEAVAEIGRCAGTQFCPRTVRAFMRCVWSLKNENGVGA